MGADLYFMRDEMHHEDMQKKNAKIRQLEDCLMRSIDLLDWFVHCSHGVGKAGTSPEPSEWKDLLDQCEEFLKDDKCWRGE